MEDRRSKYDKVLRGVWKAVETKAEKIRVAKTKERRKERGKAKETRRKEIEKGKRKKKKEKTKEEENNVSQNKLLTDCDTWT